MNILNLVIESMGLGFIYAVFLVIYIAVVMKIHDKLAVPITRGIFIAFAIIAQMIFIGFLLTMTFLQ